MACLCSITSGASAGKLPRLEVTWWPRSEIIRKFLYPYCCHMARVTRRLSLPGALNWNTYTLHHDAAWASQAWWLNFEKNFPRASSPGEYGGLHSIFSPRLRRHTALLWIHSRLYTESLRPPRFKGREHSQMAGLFENHHIENSDFIFLFLTVINMRYLTYCFGIYDFSGGW